MDSSTEVSPYLKNPQPYVAPHESASQEFDNSELQTATSFSPEEIADVRAAVAELLVFGFHGTRLNNHARSLIAMGKCLSVYSICSCGLLLWTYHFSLSTLCKIMQLYQQLALPLSPTLSAQVPTVLLVYSILYSILTNLGSRPSPDGQHINVNEQILSEVEYHRMEGLGFRVSGMSLMNWLIEITKLGDFMQVQEV